ncbi:hypothetical protein AVEN_31878-1 [Araneus ventricosus]|uniref:Uncharacterized protein n=1 Tax=Araneus ventricosus TaxID=182803 RepID=A0A4Y2F619_ARAVE|nr:hypothetical protein AVEN_31878-1 [Araneus ventricosus]
MELWENENFNSTSFQLPLAWIAHLRTWWRLVFTFPTTYLSQVEIQRAVALDSRDLDRRNCAKIAAVFRTGVRGARVSKIQGGMGIKNHSTYTVVQTDGELVTLDRGKGSQNLFDVCCSAMLTTNFRHWVSVRASEPI